jgi:hypothetical protein
MDQEAAQFPTCCVIVKVFYYSSLLDFNNGIWHSIINSALGMVLTSRHESDGVLLSKAHSIAILQTQGSIVDTKYINIFCYFHASMTQSFIHSLYTKTAENNSELYTNDAYTIHMPCIFCNESVHINQKQTPSLKQTNSRSNYISHGNPQTNPNSPSSF